MALIQPLTWELPNAACVALKRPKKKFFFLIVFHYNVFLIRFFVFFVCFFFWWPHLWHMEVPRVGDESELQLPACSTATATEWQDFRYIHQGDESVII